MQYILSKINFPPKSCCKPGLMLQSRLEAMLKHNQILELSRKSQTKFEMLLQKVAIKKNDSFIQNFNVKSHKYQLDVDSEKCDCKWDEM